MGAGLVNIVHWKDVVGKDFMDEFVRITRAIMTADANNFAPETAYKKVSLEARRDYKTKRDVMRFCGYEETRVGWKRHGWFVPFLYRNELRFTCTVEAPYRKYVTLGQFISWKNYNIVDQMREPGDPEFEFEEEEVAGGF